LWGQGGWQKVAPAFAVATCRSRRLYEPAASAAHRRDERERRPRSKDGHAADRRPPVPSIRPPGQRAPATANSPVSTHWLMVQFPLGHQSQSCDQQLCPYAALLAPHLRRSEPWEFNSLSDLTVSPKLARSAGHLGPPTKSPASRLSRPPISLSAAALDAHDAARAASQQVATAAWPGRRSSEPCGVCAGTRGGRPPSSAQPGEQPACTGECNVLTVPRSRQARERAGRLCTGSRTGCPARQMRTGAAGAFCRPAAAFG
jgi:hypothetical protein